MGNLAQKAQAIFATFPERTRPQVAALHDLDGDPRLSPAARKRAGAPFDQTVSTLYQDGRDQIAATKRAARQALERERSRGLAQLLSDPQKYESVARQAAQLGPTELARFARAAVEAGDAGLAVAIQHGVASRPPRDTDAAALEPLAGVGAAEREAALAELVAVQHLEAQFVARGPLSDHGPLMAAPEKVLGLADAAAVVPGENGEPVALPDSEVARLLEIAGVK